jgi:hypothetical protein
MRYASRHGPGNPRRFRLSPRLGLVGVGTASRSCRGDVDRLTAVIGPQLAQATRGGSSAHIYLGIAVDEEVVTGLGSGEHDGDFLGRAWDRRRRRRVRHLVSDLVAQVGDLVAEMGQRIVEQRPITGRSSGSEVFALERLPAGRFGVAKELHEPAKVGVKHGNPPQPRPNLGVHFGGVGRAISGPWAIAFML